MVGSSTGMCEQRSRRLRVRDRLADGDAFHSGDGQNVAGPAKRLLDPLETFEGVELRDPGALERPVQLRDSDFVTQAQRAREHAPDGQPPQVVAVIQVGDQQLQHRRRGRPTGPGICFRMASNSGSRFSEPSSSDRLATPALAFV